MHSDVPLGTGKHVPDTLRRSSAMANSQYSEVFCFASFNTGMLSSLRCAVHSMLKSCIAAVIPASP
eukprot:scaffold442_cov397-Prasinococcus_capsulatus_cf.AAC.41